MSNTATLAKDVEPNRPLPRADLSAFPLDDDLVIYDPQNGQSFVLNATGRIIWSLCDGSRSRHMIAEEMSASFDISYERTLDDVTELLSELRKANLLIQR